MTENTQLAPTSNGNGAAEKKMPIYIEKAISEMGREKVRLLKDAIAPDLNLTELGLFIEVSKIKKLDPFSRQIYAMKRWDSRLGREKMTIMTGIDGFRTLAERTGKYVGQKGPYWCGPDGEWKDVWLSPEKPAAAKVEILRSDFSEPLVGIAVFAEYAQTKRGGGLVRMWEQMSSVMIAKCAEAIALRRAFPTELSGLCTSDEIGHDEEVMHTKQTMADEKEALKPITVGDPGTRTMEEINNAAPDDVVDADFEEPGHEAEPEPVTRTAEQPVAGGASATKTMLNYVRALDSCQDEGDYNTTKTSWAETIGDLPRGHEYVEAYEQFTLTRLVEGAQIDADKVHLVEAIEKMKGASA